MKEEFLHYAWQYRLFAQESLVTIQGDPIKVIDVGQRNLNAGPDFFNAKILIGNTMWAGNVEIHLSASDWYLHSHHLDSSYDSIVLHVVWRSDSTIYRKNGEVIPQLILPITAETIKRKNLLDSGECWIKCERFWNELNPQFFTIQLSKLLYERLHRKADVVFALLKATQNDWEEVFYKLLLKSFGLHVNSFPFEQLSKSLPLAYIRKHRDNLFQLEALLLGQASLLGENDLDDYQHRLKSEYSFLKSKFQLLPIDKNIWKFSKMRPSNFPTIKLAQFASLLFRTDNLFSSLLQARNIETIRGIFKVAPSSYWDTHYQLGKTSVYRSKQLSENTIDLLIINAVIPLLFAYAQQREDEVLLERLFTFLEQLPPENNATISGWKYLNVVAKNAYESQALIELKREYCDLKKCLRCAIGHTLLSLSSDPSKCTSKMQKPKERKSKIL